MTGSARKPSRSYNAMASKNRTQIPRPPSRKRKPSVRLVPPRPKGEVERLAVRRLSAMKYRLAGATYSVIAEKLTEERAQAYADEKGISFERAMTRIKHVSIKTVWEDVTAEMEDLRRETEVQRSDLMALENARLDQYAGIGLIAGGVLLATLWADTPVAESLTFHTASRRRVSRRVVRVLTITRPAFGSPGVR